MKKMILFMLLCACMFLIFGCSADSPQEEGAESGTPVASAPEYRVPDIATWNEPETEGENPYYPPPPCLIVDGTLYYCYMEEAENDDYEVTGRTAEKIRIPEEEGQSSFLPESSPYSFTDDELYVYYNEKWYRCEQAYPY